MAKQTINIGSTANDGTGSTIRAGGDLINDNFNEIYTALGSGTALNVDTSGASNGQALVFNSGSGKFVAGTPSVTSSFTISGDGGSNQTISSNDTLNIQGGTGIDTTGVATDTLTIAIDSSVVTKTGTQTLSAKTLTTPVINAGAQLKNGATSAGFLEFFEDSDNGTNKVTLIGPASTADVTVVLPAAADTLVGKATTDTLTNKSIDSDNNTITNIVNANIKANAGIVNSKLANSTITVTGDSGSTAIDLGDTLTINGAGGLTAAMSGDTLTLTQASAALTYSKTKATGDGSTVGFTINSGRAVDDMLVFVNGICLVPTDDYTISSTTLTFVTAPAASAEITFRYLPI